MNRSRGIVAAAALAGALVSGGWLLQRGLVRGGDTTVGAQLFQQVLDHVQQQYVDSDKKSRMASGERLRQESGLSALQNELRNTDGPNRIDMLVAEAKSKEKQQKKMKVQPLQWYSHLISQPITLKARK